MVKKAPRRTAERILEVTQDLFNRFGEPHVSTAMLAGELGISPGNLYYHFPAKDELVNALLDRHEQALGALHARAGLAGSPQAACAFVRAVAEGIWDFRFLYRDPQELLTRNRRLETRLQQILQAREQALGELVGALRREGALAIEAADGRATALNMAALLTGWVSYAGVRAPREALEPSAAAGCATESARQALHLLTPYVSQTRREPWRDALGALATPAPEQSADIQPEPVH